LGGLHTVSKQLYTYHPKDLVENENLKKYAWDDFKFIRDKYLYGK